MEYILQLPTSVYMLVGGVIIWNTFERVRKWYQFRGKPCPKCVGIPHRIRNRDGTRIHIIMRRRQQ